MSEPSIVSADQRQPAADDDFGWDWEDDADSVVSGLVDALPPQLHPAVSLGLQRVSSCAYFSTIQGAGSVSVEADMYSLSSAGGGADIMSCMSDHHHHRDQQQQAAAAAAHAADWLYHDVIMHVFTFLDAKSLAAFSETAKRMNYEVFYFLQLQLQRALLEDNLTSSLGKDDDENKKPKATAVGSVLSSSNTNPDRLAAIAGSWTISRLASMNKQEAKDVVQEYLDSNCTLRTMPLSHSLAYIRQLLRRNGFPMGIPGQGGGTFGVGSGRRRRQPGQGHEQHHNTQSLTTSAAVLIGLMGAAAVMSGNVDVEAVESFGTELPNMLFKVGFVGSLMGAARHGWESQNKARRNNQANNNNNDDDNTNNTQSTMRETAEQMARALQEMVQQVRLTAASASAATATATVPSSRQQQQEAQDGFFARRMYDAFLAASGVSNYTNNNTQLDNSQQQQQQQQEEEPFGAAYGPWSPNPYEHLPPHGEEEEKVDEYYDDDDDEVVSHDDNRDNNNNSSMMLGFRVPMARRVMSMSMSISSSSPSRNNHNNKLSPTTALNSKMPSGCVGAYFKAIQRASKSITELVQKERQDRFEKLPNKDDVARSFIDACCSDDSLDVVKNLVQLRSVIDASGFYVGSDGTETCALHASAFHGATRVLEFLCGGIDERDPSQDEGLCSVDLQDVNGWTALHFAAGANCVESARILADRGANLSVVAENGYTPLQWAQRLSNHEVAEELRIRLEQNDSYQTSNHRWIAGASQPLSMIAHRFFAMIPTH